MTATGRTDGPQTGWIKDRRHHLPIRVYYEDTDAGGIVYHANYLRFFERARGEMLRLVGIDHVTAWRDQPAGERMGFAVRRVELEYFRPAILDDSLDIQSIVLATAAAYVDVQQAVLRDGVLLARADLRVALVNDNGRPCRLPLAWRTILKALEVPPEARLFARANVE
ncbi:4-hydroxybenzoyl-CoA thioesterase [Iodidimonas gelatinilytica]|uniref:4-hydroxybenzoyl-CoA thioesterase n=1 Tax=Iodidimonas gelatinilytica TaxID=1236966 RepID=A0A5A7N4K6_9PROT|nr:YbgC/FadM family acyl-CoA thioesterase [Iodidimonas gelatinilytica]GER02009.1 4-hydroxybenzoyl-CoA thioesterase [Iodidimonas gelatinilytica]